MRVCVGGWLGEVEGPGVDHCAVGMLCVGRFGRFCGVAWLFHLNNIAKAIVIVDVKTARGRMHFLKILCAPI